LIIGALLDGRYYFLDDVVLDLLPVRRYVPLADAIEIFLANFQRVLTEITRYFVNHILDTEHALRPAEPAKRRIGNRMRFAAMRNDAYIFEVISVVAVKHRAVIYRARQIGRHAAARREHELDTLDPASTVETDVVIDDEIVPLARHDHVVVAVEAQLAGAPRFIRHQSGNAGNQCRLAFFAAKGTTHTAAFNDNIFRLFADC